MNHAFQLIKPPVLSLAGAASRGASEPALELQLCQLKELVSLLQGENDSLRINLTQTEHEVVRRTALPRNARQRELELRATLVRRI